MFQVYKKLPKYIQKSLQDKRKHKCSIFWKRNCKADDKRNKFTTIILTDSHVS